MTDPITNRRCGPTHDPVFRPGWLQNQIAKSVAALGELSPATRAALEPHHRQARTRTDAEQAALAERETR